MRKRLSESPPTVSRHRKSGSAPQSAPGSYPHPAESRALPGAGGPAFWRSLSQKNRRAADKWPLHPESHLWSAASHPASFPVPALLPPEAPPLCQSAVPGPRSSVPPRRACLKCKEFRSAAGQISLSRFPAFPQSGRLS